MSAVVAKDLSRNFAAVEALNHLDLSVDEGELLGLIGADGAGKTTALRILTGVLKPTSGEVRVFGRDPADPSADVRHLLGYMPQRYSLYGDLSIGENLRFFGDLFGLSRSDFAKRVERLLDITRLGPFVDRRAEALSGGMYKKLALSCALLHRPRLLVLDEPTNGVDPISRIELWDLLHEFVAEGIAVVVSTSYMDEALRCARISLIHKGRELVQGAPTDLVAGFAGEVWRLGCAGAEADALLLPWRTAIIGITPVGRSTRVVVHKDRALEFANFIRQQQTAAERISPSFEDLFLELVTKEGVCHA